MTSSIARVSSVAVAAAVLCISFAAQADDVIKIGIPVGLSGANSVVAPSVVQSAELAVEEINAAGGVLGKKLALEVADDGSGAAGAQKAFDSLIFQKKVDVLISMETSAARNAGLPIVTRGKTPFIYTSFYEGRSCNKYMYVNAWVPDQQVAPIVDYFNKNSRRRPSSWSAATTPSVAACSSSPAATSRRPAARSWARSTCRWTAATGPR